MKDYKKNHFEYPWDPGPREYIKRIIINRNYYKRGIALLLYTRLLLFVN